MAITIFKQFCITVHYQPLGEGGALFSSVESLKQGNNECSMSILLLGYIIGCILQVLHSHIKP